MADSVYNALQREVERRQVFYLFWKMVLFFVSGAKGQKIDIVESEIWGEGYSRCDFRRSKITRIHEHAD